MTPNYIFKIFLFSLVTFGSVSLCAQAQQVSYQVFQLDSLQEIELELVDTYTIEPWAAEKLMAQSTIKIYNASQDILEHLLETDRYAINVDTLDHRLRLVSADQNRKKIKTSQGDCFEVIELILYLPENFIERGPGLYVRKPEETKPTKDEDDQ